MVGHLLLAWVLQPDKVVKNVATSFHGLGWHSLSMVLTSVFVLIDSLVRIDTRFPCQEEKGCGEKEVNC